MSDMLLEAFGKIGVTAMKSEPQMRQRVAQTTSQARETKVEPLATASWF